MAAAKMSSSSSKAAAMTTTAGNSHKFDCLRTYPLGGDDDNNSNNLSLTVAQGSVIDFRSRSGAIVNAANEGCLGGGGVDGAITSAGGLQLELDRAHLPMVGRRSNGFGDSQIIRCPTGDAKMTGPGKYGSLRVPFVIHAVGPNYMHFDEEKDVETPHRLLRSAYQASLDCTLLPPNNTDQQPRQQPAVIKKIAFSLLSAGVFRGDQSLGTVLAVGVEAIRDWARDNKRKDGTNNNSKLEHIVLFAFTDREARTLLRVCDIFLTDITANNSNIGKTSSSPSHSPPTKKAKDATTAEQDKLVETCTNQEENAAESAQENLATTTTTAKEEASSESKGSNDMEESTNSPATEGNKAKRNLAREDKLMTDADESSGESPNKKATEKIVATEKVMTDVEASSGGEELPPKNAKKETAPDEVMTDVEESSEGEGSFEKAEKESPKTPQKEAATDKAIAGAVESSSEGQESPPKEAEKEAATDKAIINIEQQESPQNEKS